MKKKNPFNWGTYVTLIGVVVIFAIIFTDAIDTIYVLPVLGALALYTVFSDFCSPAAARSRTGFNCPMLQLILGAFVIFIGMIEALHLNLTQRFWDIFLISHCGGHCDLDVSAETQVKSCCCS